MIKKFKKNNTALSTMIIVAVVVVIIVVAAVAGYWYMSQNPASPSNTGTPGPSTTAAPTGTASDIAHASSLKYSVAATENGTSQGTYTFMGKNIGTDNFQMRIEFTKDNNQDIYIFNGATKKAWTYSGGEWVDISSYYSQQWDIWNNMWTGYTHNLTTWTGSGDQTYTQDGTTVRIYDIQVNPTLDDTLFTHS